MEHYEKSGCPVSVSKAGRRLAHWRHHKSEYDPRQLLIWPIELTVRYYTDSAMDRETRQKESLKDGNSSRPKNS